MEFENVKELIKTVNSSDISLFELKTDTIFVKIDKSLTRNENEHNLEESISNVRENYKEEKVVKEKDKNINISSEKIIQPSEVVSEDEEEELIVVKAPMVGTFYSSPSEDADNFVKVGDSIKLGDTLCIIEAMKLMNEIESQVNGVVKSVLVKNGEMVEYGQPIFKVKEV